MLRPVIEAELRKAGYPAAEVFIAGASYNTADYQSATLRFADRGITHVLSASNDVLYFMTQAESQVYRPRYAITTWGQPGALLQLTAPEAQLTGALGVGYVPALDVDAENDPGDVSPTTTLCRKLMMGAGQATSVRLTFLVMLAECEMTYLLKQVIDSQGSLTNEALMTGIDTIGRTFRSGMTFATQFAPGRHDGVTSVRDLAYIASCSCFRYASAVRAF